MTTIDHIMALHDEAAEAKAEATRLDYETWHRRFKRDAIHKEVDDTKQALRTAIEQALADAREQEPVAVVKAEMMGMRAHIIGEVSVGDLLYKAAPQPAKIAAAIRARKDNSNG